MFSPDFVAAGKEFCDYCHHVPAPYLRKNFTLEALPKKARLTVCGLGFYEVYINGKHITKGALAPYISNPDHILYYDTYELTPFLQTGNNTLAFLLGNGMLNAFGGTAWDFDKAAARSAPKVAFSLELDDICLNADESIKVHPSPILMDDLHCGEFYDANCEIEGWNLPDFNDSAWQNAIPAETPRGTPTLCAADPIVVYDRLRPRSITPDRRVVLSDWWHELLKARLGEQLPLAEQDCVGYLYDFGQNTAGNITLRIKGVKGQRVSILFGELLTENGDLDNTDKKFLPHLYDHRVVYTLKGEGVEEYTPYFSFQGFRYCLVSGITAEQANEDLLTYQVMSSALQKNGDFTCSDDIVCRLQQAAYRSDRSNFFYFPMDCPHREKNGWTGDAQLSAEQMLFNLTPANSYRVWLDNIRAAQREDGALPGIVPTYDWGFAWGNGPGYDAVIFELPYQLWKQLGDTDTIRKNAEAMHRNLTYIADKRNENGLIKCGLGDWLPTKYRMPMAPRDYTDTLLTMDVCQKAGKMFAVIGDTERQVFAENLYNELRWAARNAFLQADGTVADGGQTAQAMALAYGLVTETEKEAVFAKLMEAACAADEHMDVGVFGARVLFHVLAAHGQAEVAYRMITRTDAPSFGHWIVGEDATTLFERFDVVEGWPGSKNHHFWGDISSWFFRCITGVQINPNDTDHKEILLAPNFISTLTFAHGYQHHPCGKVECRWQRQEDGAVELTFALPEGCHGRIAIPHGWRLQGDTVLRNGTYLFIPNRNV